MTVGIVTGAARGMGAACAERMAGMVDVLVLVDRDDVLLATQADMLAAAGYRAQLEPFVLDVKDPGGITRLAARVAELGPLRAVAHAAGVSPTMADWRDILTVNLIGTARLVEACRALAVQDTAVVCFASVAALLALDQGDLPPDAVLDDPLAGGFLERIHEAVGPAIEDPGMAYTWSKRGVHRLVRREAVRFGRVGARICSVTPGMIDTPMGRQEAEARCGRQLIEHSNRFARQHCFARSPIADSSTGRRSARRWTQRGGGVAFSRPARSQRGGVSG